MEKIITATWEIEDSHTLPAYTKQGGYTAARKALKMPKQKVVEEVKKANLRGRGGAGFPCGVKWGFLPKGYEGTQYLVINADEGEPGTFKDRYIMWNDPHRMIEGCIIAAHACGLRTCYVYIRGEFAWIGKRVEEAIQEAYKAGHLGKQIMGTDQDFDIYVHYGAGAYVCGEETGLLESIEGKPGQPRNKPPFPALVGLFGCPTIINNVETITCVQLILDKSGEWFAGLGCENNGGTKLMGVSGHVKTPGMFEARCGIPLKDVIYEIGGGILDDRKLKAVVPGGLSCPVLLPDEIEGVMMSIESMQEAGTMLGTGGVIVMHDQTCIVRYAARAAHFYHHESCGQCTPCREGSGWIKRILDKIEAGQGQMEEIDLMLDICDNVQGNTICALGDAFAMPLRSLIEKFRGEFEKHIKTGKCPFPSW